jgi:hypothetical protein
VAVGVGQSHTVDGRAIVPDRGGAQKHQKRK